MTKIIRQIIHSDSSVHLNQDNLFSIPLPNQIVKRYHNGGVVFEVVKCDLPD